MGAIISLIDSWVGAIPLALLEVWGRFSYFVGAALAVCAFGGFTFRIGERWGFGRERFAWNTKAFLAVPLTLVLVILSGYLGSFIVLVPGAQTFESLKDLVVLLCIVYFGYPALLAVPPAYMLSDLIEGVPPSFVRDWAEGYFFWTAFVWMALQLIGRDPDFRLPRTWARYAVFVATIMFLDPVMWGYICSGKFTSLISYRNITSALFFTLVITWVLAPLAFLLTLPVVKRLGWFWAEIPGHVRARWMGSPEWIWESGRGDRAYNQALMQRGLPIRVFIFLPFILLVLIMVGVTATVSLRAAAIDSDRLASNLHQETSDNVRMQLDDFLARALAPAEAASRGGLDALLRDRTASANGRAFILDGAGKVIASSADAGDGVVSAATAALAKAREGLPGGGAVELKFDHVTAKPLSRDTWLTQATTYDRGPASGWTLVTAMPESYYLSGLRAGHGRSAIVFALALVISLILAAILASTVTAPLRRISIATGAMAQGDMETRVSGGSLDELAALAASFNDMALKLKRSFDDLSASESRARESEDRLQLAIDAGGLGIWDWHVDEDRLVWDDSMYPLYGVRKEDFSGAYDAWAASLVAEDRERSAADVTAALRGERKFLTDFRVRRRDGAVRILRGEGQVIRDASGRAVRMVGINWDVTDLVTAERQREELLAELRQHREQLEALVASRTAELQRANQELGASFESLRSLEKLRDDLVHMIVHDMATPLTAVLGRLHVIKLTPEAISTDAGEDLDAAIDAVVSLASMSHDLLDVSRMEAGRMPITLSICDLARIAHEVCTSMRASDPERVLEVEASAPVEISCDAALVRRVLVNLVSNGFKHTPKGSPLRVVVTRVAQGARVEVRDRGTGVAPDYRAKIFEKFGTIEARHSRSYHSVGLGLAFCKLAVEAHGGTIGVDDGVPTGSNFWFTLPDAQSLSNSA